MLTGGGSHVTNIRSKYSQGVNKIVKIPGKRFLLMSARSKEKLLKCSFFKNSIFDNQI